MFRIFPFLVCLSVCLSVSMQEAEYRDADVKLVEEDMAVMTDFELHQLCLQHQVHYLILSWLYV